MPINLREVRARTAKNFDLRAKADDKSADLILYGPIGVSFWDETAISAKQVSDALKNLDPATKEINVRINSPGGDVFEGIAIMNRLKQHKAQINVFVDGLAASIASIIMLAGDEVTVGEGALVMIHNPWTVAMGDKNDLDNTINRLLDIEQQMISIYNRKTKMDRSELAKLMDEETWMDADTAIQMGFADRKADEALPIAASVFDKSTWISKAPKSFKSQSTVAKNELKLLKDKIAKRLAR